MLKQHPTSLQGQVIAPDIAHNGIRRLEELAYGLDSKALLQLLYIYQGIISARPIDTGNLEFLECMLSASQKIMVSLNSSSILKERFLTKLSTINKLIDDQTFINAKKLSGEVLTHLSELLRKSTYKKPCQKFYLETTLPALPHIYQNIHIVFGPGLGLGDQITFYSFLKCLIRYCPGCQPSIYTLYPSLWRNLLPEAKEIHYRDKPLRPFYQISAFDRIASERTRELVVVADFDAFGFHQDIIPSEGRDVLEIALGKGSAWLNQFDSPWIKFETFSSIRQVGNNYWILAKLADRLFPAPQPHPGWAPIATRPLQQQRSKCIKTIFINPFTSKKYDLQPEDWYHFLTLLKKRMGDETAWDIIIFPGLNPKSQESAAQICHLCQSGPIKIPARVLQSKEGKLPTVYDTFKVLSEELPKISLVITVDTFTGHFMPLYGIPTLVITDRDNRAFWVPGRWNYYCLLNRMKVALPGLAASILNIHKEDSLSHPEIKKLINKIMAITEGTNLRSVDQIEIGELQALLFSILKQLPQNFPYKSQGQKWVIRWGQLAAAIKKDPAPTDAILPYIQNWQQSEFFKLISINTTEE